MVLEKISGPEDIRKLKEKELPVLAQEIRTFLVDKISRTGGHLASNLGVVELTMAIFLSFQLPEDKIIWDVGHQSYTHKILSGRKEEFDDLRQLGGLSGFPKTRESPCDAFNTGHSSTSISAGLGLAQARDLCGEHYYVVSVIGDGALTGGMAYEALNNASRLKKNFIIILNDNNMSISENVGGISSYLSLIRTGSGYNKLKDDIRGALEKLPAGHALREHISKTKAGLKQLLIPGMFFEDMGITYLGPVDGHDIRKMTRMLQEAKKVHHAVLVHVITKKGKGYGPAERWPARFHGVEPFDIATGKSKKTGHGPGYSQVFAGKLTELAAANPRLVAVTAAMPDGTGLSAFAKQYPNRFFDVGIAEQHAVTSAAGMAAGGLIPVVAVYSSFLQRGFDQILHDICIQRLHVILAVDRAGLVGSDGETHQGIFDLSYLGMIPNMTILAPKNDRELEAELAFAVQYEGPVAIRYPRGEAYQGLRKFAAPIEYGKAELLYEESKIALLALGSMVSTAEHVRNKLKEEGIPVSLVNMRFAKPIDETMLDRIADKHPYIVTMEENVARGGMGCMAAAYLHARHPEVRVLMITLPDAYVEHGNVSLLREMLGIDSDSIIRRMKQELLPDISRLREENTGSDSQSASAGKGTES